MKNIQDRTLVNTVAIPMSRVREMLNYHGYSEQFWTAIKIEMRSKGFTFPAGDRHMFTTRTENGALVHKLYKLAK